MADKHLVIGTRGSDLALWQSTHIKTLLETHPAGLTVELKTIRTTGDKILDSPLSKIGDKGLFTKELEHALLDQAIDLAVHSLKDIPTQIPEGLAIGAVTQREDVRDVFVSHPSKGHKHLSDLPSGAVLATGSLRRRCQLLQIRPDFKIVDIRGNLATRMKKLEESDWDGMLLARAGMLRLGWESRITEILPPETVLPAVGQGALGIEIRENDEALRSLLSFVHDQDTAAAVKGERALLRWLEGGCQVPIGTYGRMEAGAFFLDAMIGSLDGKRVVRGNISGPPDESEKLGVQLAQQLFSKGGKTILDEIRSTLSDVPGVSPP
ncbi:MAG: hydroxymethylbilane synthase [Ignavibacteriales bacterium]|nr:hydroxymethylbilane synthase [Ignavibacteriales bacterium]